MNKFTLGIALAASLVAGVASAATVHGTRTMTVAPAAESYAAASRYDMQPGYVAGDGATVVVDGKIVGRDPDANIRNYMMRDAYIADQP